MNGMAPGPNIVTLHRHKHTGKYDLEPFTMPANNLVKKYNEYNTNHPIDLRRGERKTTTVHYLPGTQLRITSVGM